MTTQNESKLPNVCDTCLTAMYDELVQLPDYDPDDDGNLAEQTNLALTAGEIIPHMNPGAEMVCEEIEFFRDEEFDIWQECQCGCRASRKLRIREEMASIRLAVVQIGG